MVRLLSASVAAAVAVGACSIAVNAAPVRQTPAAAASFASTKAKALQGDVRAQYNLGETYLLGWHGHGSGPASDFSAAVSWYRRAAEQGYAPAQDSLGGMYEIGLGVALNYTTAFSWYRRAAEQGYAPAQNNLGARYYIGRGVAQDYAAAFNWFRKAAEQGHSVAQDRLGGMYEYGTGVPQDYVQAHKWYNLAGASADALDVGNRDKATKNRDIVAAKMQPAQIAEAQRLASAWRKK
jgi:TPR repeat protein